MKQAGTINAEAMMKIVNVEHPLLMKAWEVIQLHVPEVSTQECETCDDIHEYWSCQECDWTGDGGDMFMLHLQALAGLSRA